MSALKIKQLGFEKGNNVVGRVSIADLFSKSKIRCGIYLLQFQDGTFYIGQAVDAVRRFAQHRKNYDTISQYWFQPVTKGQLDEAEQRLIREAEQAGLLLTNKTFVTNIIGETDLDLLVSVAEQDAWLAQGQPLNNENINLSASIEEKYRVKYRKNFQQLQQLSAYPRVKALLHAYITQGIPAYQKTEQAFWALSCLPATGKNLFRRYFTLNINGMEVLAAGVERQTNHTFAFAIVTGTLFTSSREKTRFLNSYAYHIEPSAYQAAGADQYRIDFKSMKYLLYALEQEPAFRQSIREMNLRLMRRGGTIYSPYHCFDLALNVLNE